MKPNKTPNARQVKFLDLVTEWAKDNIQDLYGDEFCGHRIQRHHCVGRSYVQNKVHIGQDFVIPVPFELHDVSSNHPLSVTDHRLAFVNHFGPERDLFATMIESMIDQGYERLSLPSDEVLKAVASTRR